MPTSKLTSILKTFDIADAQIGHQHKGTNTAWIMHHKSGDYVLKCMTYSSPEDVQNLIQSCTVMDHLSQHGFPCPKPIKNTQGTYVTREQNLNYHLATIISGQADWNAVTLSRIEQAGACMGQFHRLQSGLNLPAPADLRERIANSLNRIQTEWDTFGMHRTDIREAADDALDRLEERWQAQSHLPSGWMHTDATPGNMLFQNDNLTGLIDFELIPGTFLFDMCMSAIRWAPHFDLETTTNHLNSSWLKHFISAYQTQRPLSHAENDALHDTLLLAATWSWGRQRPHIDSDPLWRLTSRGEIYIALSQ